MVIAGSSLLTRLDERMSVKMLQRRWAPRMYFIVRLLLVATFIDDSIRVATHFWEHSEQAIGYMHRYEDEYPSLIGVTSAVFLAGGLVAQVAGVLLTLLHVQVDLATRLLVGWVLVHPVLYGQLGNTEFCAESISLVGGILVMRAHALGGLRKQAGSNMGDGEGFSRTQLLGRLLLPTLYLYHAGASLLANLVDLEHKSSHSVPIYIIDVVVMGIIGVGVCLVTAGLCSRAIALSLALINMAFGAHEHPFWRMVWLDASGKWVHAELTGKDLPHLVMPEGLTPDDFEPWQVVDVHRYFFFQGLSTSGALLLLTLHGPGKLAVEENELLLVKVERAKD